MEWFEKVDEVLVLAAKGVTRFMADWFFLSRFDVTALLFLGFCLAASWGLHLRVLLATLPLLVIVAIVWFISIWSHKNSKSPILARMTTVILASLSVLCISLGGRHFDFHMFFGIASYVASVYVNADDNKQGRGKRVRKSLASLIEMFGSWTVELPVGEGA